MNKIEIITLISLVLTSICTAQNVEVYSFSSQIETKISNDTVFWNYQTYAIEFANIGEYRRNLEIEDVLKKSKLDRIGNSKLPNTANVQYLKSFKAVDAKKKIIEEAKKHRIIIINEEHNSPLNRVFINSLLPDLKKIGYSIYLSEGVSNSFTLNKGDSLLNERKYPTLNSGFLLKEPQFGNLVRNALKNGYDVYGYDHPEDKTKTDFMERLQSRETGQAENIKKILNKNPSAKILIHCGRGHLTETLTDSGFGFMGAMLKEKTGIDPFTINQARLLETSTESTANPYRVEIDRNPPKKPSVFINKQNEYFDTYPDEKPWDVVVYFPTTNYKNGRPDWLSLNKKNKAFNIPKDKISIEAPYLIFAYHKDEDIENTIPADILEIGKDEEQKYLILEKGKYILFIKGENGKTQKIEIKV